MADAEATAEQEREALNTGTDVVPEAQRFDEASLERWLKDHVEGYGGPLEVRKFKGGQSNPTYQLITPAKKYVLRRKPPGKLLPSAHAVDREYRVITALGPTGFPVARTYGLCNDDGVIGTWFYIMDNVEGRIFWDQTLPSCQPPERRAIFMDKIKTLADLHNTDYVKIGLEDFGKPGNYMGRQVDRWTKQYKASETTHIPEMEKLIEWLPRTLPEQEKTSIVHGDYRLDNMIFRADQPKVAAVLDWELCTLGDPLADFTYLLMNWLNGSLSQVNDLKERGIPTVQEAVEHYCSLTGRKGLHDLDWFASYNTFRLAGILQGIVGRVRDGTANSPHAAQQADRVIGLAQASWKFAQRAGATG
jgi:aminoglycoside phosphotransferase (APT) family kinase protein